MVAEQSPLLIDFLQNLYNERKKLIDGEISMILLLKKVHNIQRAMRNINNGMLNYTRPRTQLLLSFEDAVKEGDWEIVQGIFAMT